MSNREEEFYRQKYLKYKAKYLEAKNELEGGNPVTIGACQKCDGYIYFFNGAYAKINEIITKNHNELQKMSSGCDFDKKIRKLLQENNAGDSAYIEIRSTNIVKSLTKSISADKSLENNAKLTLNDADYTIKGSFPTAKMVENGIVNDTLLNAIAVVGKFPFTCYIIKNYKCLFKGSNNIGLLKEYPAK